MRKARMALFEWKALGVSGLVPVFAVALGTVLLLLRAGGGDREMYSSDTHSVFQYLFITLAGWLPVCAVGFVRETPGCSLYTACPVSVWYWGILRMLGCWLSYCALLAVSVSAVALFSNLTARDAAWQYAQMCMGSLMLSALGFAAAALTRNTLISLLMLLSHLLFYAFIYPQPERFRAYWLSREFPNPAMLIRYAREIAPPTIVLIALGQAAMAFLPPRREQDG